MCIIGLIKIIRELLNWWMVIVAFDIVSQSGIRTWHKD